jgi:D-alanyl-D-alanine carboxypeptidase
MRRLVALLLLATAPAAFAAKRRAVVPPPPELAVPAADSIAAAAIAEGVPGLSIAVRKGDLTFARAYGLFDREAGIPARTDTVFSTGSLTKQFTAAAIVRLEDQGKLSIDDKARKFLPELDGRFDAITIRHLLHHTSGVREYVTQLTSVTDPKTRQEIFAMITGAGPLFPAGSRFEYSNSGYYLLGVIIERASAQTYEQFVRDTFFTPMGLSTSFSGETAPPPRGYTVSPAGQVTLDSVADPSLLYANGSICSTASDLVRWTTSLVASPLYTRMIGDRVVSARPGADYGYGLIIDTFEGRVRVWHDGGVPGFTSELVWFPEEKISVAVLMNLNDERNDRVGEVANAIAHSLFVQNGAVGAGAVAASAATPAQARDACASAGETPVFQRQSR